MANEQLFPSDRDIPGAACAVCEGSVARPASDPGPARGGARAETGPEACPSGALAGGADPLGPQAAQGGRAAPAPCDRTLSPCACAVTRASIPLLAGAGGPPAAPAPFLEPACPQRARCPTPCAVLFTRSGNATILLAEDARRLLVQGRICSHGKARFALPRGRNPLTGARPAVSSLARAIAQAGAGQEVHHRNDDPSDNRRANLATLSHRMHRLIHGSRARAGRVPGVQRCGNSFRWQQGNRAGKHYGPRLRSELLATFSRDDGLRALGAPPEVMAFPRRLARADLAPLLDHRGSSIFRVWFVKRSDGVLRSMLCRTGVTTGTTGQATAFDPATRGLLCVYEMTTRSYKCIPLAGVLALRLAGVAIRVEDKPDESR